MASDGRAFVGIADHCGWAVLVTVATNHAVVDRRRVELLESSLPRLPHHHEAQSLPLDQAVALIERVRDSASAFAAGALDTLAASIPVAIAGIALRACPPLPTLLAERISNYRVQTMADGIMYREVLAEAARGRGWTVHWYTRARVMHEASEALRTGTIETLLQTTGATLGRPWQQDHRVAMAAAIAASVRRHA
jgi:hypothetical protein